MNYQSFADLGGQTGMGPVLKESNEPMFRQLGSQCVCPDLGNGLYGILEH